MLIAIALFAVTVAMLWLAVRREPVALSDRRSLAIVRRPQTRAIVLAHGILGFDALSLGPVRVDYFRRVADRLRAQGLDVIAARVPPLGGVPERAAALARTLASLPHDRVTVIAHSMGGLDARWAIAQGLAPRVRELVTIGTPHRGTPIADLLFTLGLRTAAVDWLTTRKLARFADEAPDAPHVRYACVVAATRDRARVHPMLRAPHALIRGCNDGLVPASSQRWGEVLAELELDHWAQVGWSHHEIDAGTLVLDLLARLDVISAITPRNQLCASS